MKKLKAKDEEGVREDHQVPGPHHRGRPEAAARAAHGPAGGPPQGRPAHLGHRAGDRPVPDRQPREARDRAHLRAAPHPGACPIPNKGEEGWLEARKKAEEIYGQLLEGAGLRRAGQEVLRGPVRQGRRRPRQHQARGAGAGHRGGDPAPAARRGLHARSARRWATTSSGSTRERRSSGDALVQVRSQVRDILYRQKYDARLKDWLVEIKQRAIIESGCRNSGK